MDKTQTQQAAAELLRRRQAATGTQAPLAQMLTPQNAQQALAIQQAIASQRSDAIAAWKCLEPLDQEKLIVAPIFANTLQQGANCKLWLSSQGKAQIEPEIAFVLDQDFTPRSAPYSEQEIRSAIRHCHLALELMQFRFDQKIDFYTKLADCLVNQGLYLGPIIDTEKALQASQFQIDVNQSLQPQSFLGKHPNQLPQQPLFWLVNHLTARGLTLKAGQAVITGSYAGIVEVEPNQPTQIRYDGLGQFETTFEALG